MTAKRRSRSGTNVPHRERAGRRLFVYVTEPEAADELDALIVEHGSARAAVEAALLASRRQR